MIHIEEKNQLIKIEPKLTQMLELADKDIKRDTCVSHIQKLERRKACKVEIGRYFIFKKIPKSNFER